MASGPPFGNGDSPDATIRPLLPPRRRRGTGRHGRQPGFAPFVRAAWTGGHATSPYEQNTQQSPGRGRRSAPQLRQSWEISAGIRRHGLAAAGAAVRAGERRLRRRAHHGGAMRKPRARGAAHPAPGRWLRRRTEVIARRPPARAARRAPPRTPARWRRPGAPAGAAARRSRATPRSAPGCSRAGSGARPRRRRCGAGP